MTFRIPKLLETLSLIDMEAGFGVYQEGDTGLFSYDRDSAGISNLLANLGSGDPRDRNPPDPPWVSGAGLKILSASWVELDPRAVIAFLEKAPMIEEIHLTGVSQDAPNDIVTVAEARNLPPLKGLCIRWIWDDGYESYEAHPVNSLLR